MRNNNAARRLTSEVRPIVAGGEPVPAIANSASEVLVCGDKWSVARREEASRRLMFMFRSKRNNLTRRLLRAGARGCASDEDDAWREGRVRNHLLKRLKEAQLELLCLAVEGGGEEGPRSACVLVPRRQLPEAAVLCCQTWRWPDLSSHEELRRLPGCCCAAARDPVYLCCNPYHLSRRQPKPQEEDVHSGMSISTRTTQIRPQRSTNSSRSNSWQNHS